MKELFKKNKAVLQFLAVFVGCYLLLAGLYHLYLSFAASEIYYPDYITHLVAVQTQQTIEAFGYQSQILPHPHEASMRLFVNQEYLVRVVEGCNAISILILFVSFVLAFHSNFKKTFFFILGGSVLLYCLNILRIALLSIGIYHYPNYEGVLHGTIFPAVIYGSVFLLWILWVRIVSKTNKYA